MGTVTIHERAIPMKDKTLYKDRDFWKTLLRLMLPIAFQNLMLASVAASDAFMLGGLDQNSMSAVSLASQVQFIQNMCVSSVTACICILGAQYWGRKDTATIRKLAAMSLRIAGFVSLLFASACLVIPESLMGLYTNEPVLVGIGARYLRFAAASYFIAGVSQCYLSLLKVTEHTRESAVIASSCVVLNIVLNAVFIFGLFGIPAMGVVGAALATLISRAIEFVWSFSVSFREGHIHPQMRDMFSRSAVLEKDFAKCNLPILGASLLWGIGFTSYSSFMGHLGMDAAAASSVAAVVRDMVCCMCDGMANGGGIMVGNELGAGRLERGKFYGDRIMKLGYLCGFASTLIMCILTPVLMSFVKLTAQARTLLIGMMLITAFYMIGRAVNTVIINGIFAAGGDTLFDMYSLAVTMWAIAVPLAALGTYVFHWNPLIVYACTCLDEVGKIPWVMAHYRKYKWVKDLTRENV